MLRQSLNQNELNERTRISQIEMRRVIDLYDEKIGIAKKSTPTPIKETLTEQPTIGDLAELLGISTVEAQRLLLEARMRQFPTPPQQSIQRQTTVTAQQTANTFHTPGQVTVVQNVIVDTHAQNFEKFEANHGNFVATWNWGPFLFGWLWYAYKGMGLKAMMHIFLYILTLVITGGMGVFLYPFFLGLMGNYDYYLLRCHGTQAWDKKPMTVVRTYFNNGQAVPPVQASAMQAPTTQTTALRNEAELEQVAQKLQLLRDTYERGLITEYEYEEKRLVLLNEIENRENLKKLAEAHRLGLLSDAEYEEKRRRLLLG